MPGLVNRLLKILFPKTRSHSHTTEKEGKAIREELKFLVFRSEVMILMDHHNTLATILQVIIQPGTQTSMEIVTREVERVMDALVLDLLGSYDEEKRPNTEFEVGYNICACCSCGDYKKYQNIAKTYPSTKC